MRSLSSVGILPLLASVLAVAPTAVSASSSCSTGLALEFQQTNQQQCATQQDFGRAYEQLYKGLQSYLELRQYSSSQISQSSTPQSTSQSSQQLLKELAQSSWSPIIIAAEEDATVDESQTVSLLATGSDDNGSFTFAQGHAPHKSLRRSQSDHSTGAAECLEGRWCSTLKSSFCPAKRNAARRRTLEQAATSHPSQQQRQESICDWLSQQELPGCLGGATLICSELLPTN